MTDEEKKEYEELKSLLYTGTISQYGKRKLIEIIEKQSKEIEELNWKIQEQRDLLKYKSDKIEKQSKEIEELKNADLTTVYLNGFYDGEKKVEDKIKAKIEKYKKQQKEEPDAYLCIKVLQSLLEKE